MMSGQPSRTLLGTAIKRAEHQLLDTPLIFEDPVVLDLVPELADPAAVAEFRCLGEPVLVLLRSLFAMRSRFAEDRLAEAIRRGVRQYVMVGAGLDTFPWRQTDSSRDMEIFAADHPRVWSGPIGGCAIAGWQGRPTSPTCPSTWRIVGSGIN